MEELNTAPNPNETNSSNDNSESLIDKFNKPISRRGFLKAAGLVGAAALISSCAPGVLEAGSEDQKGKNFENNKKELHNQFEERKDIFLRGDGFFNYDRYTQQYPGFENYKDLIEKLDWLKTKKHSLKKQRNITMIFIMRD